MTRLILIALALLFVGSIADVPAMYLAVHGELPLAFIFIAGFLADIIPDFFWYWVGKSIGIARIERLPFFRQDPARIEAVDRVFNKYGAFLLFFSKFVYLFGIPTQIVAGVHCYPLKKFAFANTLGAAGWLVLLFYLAKVFSEVSVIETYLDDAKIAFLVFFAVAIGFHFLLGAPMKRMLKRN